MQKNYNYKRRKLFLPEYGRHIHEMVDSLMQIEDRRERNRQARAVIAVMGNLNPLLRDTADFTHKLWDHLFIMSDFQLDVDSPYPQPSRQELTTVPRRMPYSSGHIEYKHYGKYVERMIRRLADEKNPQVVSRTVDNLARYMRTKSYEYNQEHPNNEVIIKDIKKMSGNAIQIDEVALNNIRSDYKQPFMAHPQKGQKGQKGAQQRQQKNRNQHQSRNFNGKNGGALLYSPIGSMCVLRSFIPSQQKKTARPRMFRHFVPSRELHSLATLVRLSLVDLPSANSMKCCSPPASLEK